MTRHFGGGHYGNNNGAKYVVIVCVLVLFMFGFIGVIFLSSDSSTATQQPALVVHEPQIEMTTVLIPQQKIEPGAELLPSMFKKESRPKVGISGGMVKDFNQLMGGYAKSTIVPEIPLHQDFITKVKPINPITQSIPDGYRGVTIRVDAKSAVEGWAVPGAKVDVVWASRIREQQAISVIVENAQVLSADKNPDSKGAGAAVPSTVTLLVNSEDAKKIQLASISGSLSLSLRGDRDSGKSDGGNPITIDDLLGRTNNIDGKQVASCKGKVRTCKDGVCEELCLTEDGKLAPLNSLN